MGVIEQLLNNSIIGQSPLPNNVQMAQILEQTFLRFVQCTFPYDLLNTLQKQRLWTLFYDLFRTFPEV
jgi:hypothetical protein